MKRVVPSKSGWLALLVSSSAMQGVLAAALPVDSPHPAVVRHPLTISETLALRKPSEVRISPDGARVAYVVTQALAEKNQDHAILCASDATLAGPGRQLAEAIHINSVRWSRDASWLFFIAETESGRQIWRVSSGGGQPSQLTKLKEDFVHTAEFGSPSDPYQFTPDGKTVIYAVTDPEAETLEFQEKTKGGMLYKGEPYFQIGDPKLVPVPYELWSSDLAAQRARKLWQTRMFIPPVPGAPIPEFQVSPDGKKIAVLYQNSEEYQHHGLSLLDLATGAVETLSANLGESIYLQWSDDGQSLLFLSQGELRPNMSRYEARQAYVYRLSNHSLKVEDKAAGDVLNSADAVATAVEKQTGDLLHDCSVDMQKKRAVCVREASMLPPDLVTVVLNGGTPTGKPVVLTHLNPEYDQIELGDVSTLTLSKEGSEGGGPDAGLILPAEYVPGKRYPLVVILYNQYSEKRFIAKTPLLNYPAQAFAGHGYAVLIMNVPKNTFIYKEGDFGEARAAEADGMASAIRSAVDLLIGRGIVDSKRMGIMGWSFGSFWTDYIVTHHPDWFQAAASGEGGNHNPWVYWWGGDVISKQERSFYGGGPYGQYWPRWKEVAPLLNADQLRVPLLMEYTAKNPNGLQMRNAILAYGGQAELYIYSDDQHVFERPLNRYNSMTHHFDWFNFWLLGDQDSDPAKSEQYARWKQMREKLATARDEKLGEKRQSGGKE